jgi:hypothetical protein
MIHIAGEESFIDSGVPDDGCGEDDARDESGPPHRPSG